MPNYSPHRVKSLLTASLGVALLLINFPAEAAVPVVNYAVPNALLPGETTDVTFHGENLSDCRGVWLSVPSSVTVVETADDGKSLRCRIGLPSNATMGLAMLRVVTGAGASRARLVMIDDLESVVENAENKSIGNAQRVQLPVAIEGASEKESSDFFRFSAQAGQSVSIDLFARRLGYRLDPVVRVLDSSGRELAYSDDDEASGADSRMRLTIPVDGDYWIEIRDIRYLGGNDHRYHMRVGNFPLVNTTYPLAAFNRGTTRLQFTGPATAAIASAQVSFSASGENPIDELFLSTRTEKGDASVFSYLQTSPFIQQVEHEPNNDRSQSTVVSLPGSINGRFASPRDKDYFALDVKKGQRWRMIGLTRTLGSPSDLFMRLYDQAGKLLKEVDDAGTSEGVLDFTANADTQVYLEVEDLNWRGGPQYVYRVDILPYKPGFSLSVESDVLNAPQHGYLVFKVKSQRRDYAGQIHISLYVQRGESEPFEIPADYISGNTIPKDKNETQVRIRLPERFRQGDLLTCKVVGTAEIKGDLQTITADSGTSLKTYWNGLRYPPHRFTTELGLGVGAVFPEFMAVETPVKEIEYLQQLGGSFPIKIKRTNGFDGDVQLTALGLPHGFSLEPTKIKGNQAEATIRLVGPAQPAEGEFQFSVQITASYQDQPGKLTAKDLVVRIKTALNIELPEDKVLAVGGKVPVKIHLARRGKPSPVTLRFVNLPDGLSAESVALGPEKHEAILFITATDMAKPDKEHFLSLVAETEVDGKTITQASYPLRLHVVRP